MAAITPPEWTSEIESEVRRRVASLASRWGMKGDDLQDAVQDVTIDVWRAWKAYDPSRGLAPVYLARVVRWSLIDYMSKHNKVWAHEHVSTEMVEEAAEQREIEAILDAIDIEHEARTLSPLLTDMERKCMALVVEGLSYADIAEQIGCSAKGVDNALLRARAKARSR